MPYIYFLSVFVLSYLHAQIVFSEIMYDLSGPDSPNEFVEIFNRSETDTVDLTGWELRDKYSVDQLVIRGSDFLIPPGQFGLILEGDYDLAEGIYLNLLSPAVILFSVDDASIGNGLAGSDSLYLLHPDGAIEDEVGWTDLARDGYSLERVRLYHKNAPTNWTESRDSLGTPGWPNSMAPLEINLTMPEASLTMHPGIIKTGDTTLLKGIIINSGVSSASGQIQVYEESLFAGSWRSPVIPELDTVLFRVNLGPLPSGFHKFTVILDVTGDLDTSDNHGSVLLGVRYNPAIVILNEFMPTPANGQSEYVEWVYQGQDDLDLLHWRLTDGSEGNQRTLPEVVLFPGDYMVIAKDSSLIPLLPDPGKFIILGDRFPSLNNGGDMIRIFDPFDTLIDSLAYTSNWDYSTGIAMEKVFPSLPSDDSLNWLPSVNISGMTLGGRNSVTPWDMDGTLIKTLDIQTPVPGPQEPVTITAQVTNNGVKPFNAWLRILYRDQEIAAAPVATLIRGDTTDVALNLPGFESGSHPVDIFLDLSSDMDPADNEFMDTIQIHYPVGALRLNEFLAQPNNNQTEFVELVSMLEDTLKDWSLGDNSLKVFPLLAMAVSRGEYKVIAADSSIFTTVGESATVIVPQSGFPILNNTGDAIYLYDQTGWVIDSLVYDLNWPIVSERSTEKMRPEFLSNELENWRVSLDSDGMTPGYVNSVALQDVDGSIHSGTLSHDPIFPRYDEVVRLKVPIVNEGVTPFAGSVIVGTETEEFQQAVFPLIHPVDTAIISMEIPPLSSGKHILLITLTVIGDTNPDNDLAADTVQVQYPFRTVVINEFLAQPAEHQTEFIEIVSFSELELEGWAISDRTNGRYKLPDMTVGRGEYLAIGATTDGLVIDPQHSLVVPSNGFPSLNNSADGIYLYDMTGAIIDSLWYDEVEWPLTEGRSMEKYRPDFLSNDPSRWGIAVNLGAMTPGFRNSVYFDVLPGHGSVFCTPNPFSPDGDGIDDILQIQYKLPFEQAALKVEIFDMTGRQIATPYWNAVGAQEGVLTWDGRRPSGKRARIGLYLLKFRARDMNSGQTWEKLETVVLAKRL